MPEKKPNLHDLSRQLGAINRLIEANGGEITHEVALALDSTSGSFHKKVDIIRLLVSKRRHKAAWHKAQAKAHQERANAIENTADHWDEWVMSGMESAGLEVAGSVIPVRIVANGLPSIRWVDEANPIPEEFRKVKVEYAVNYDLARQALKRLGRLPDGFKVERGRHLMIAGVDTKRRKKGT